MPTAVQATFGADTAPLQTKSGEAQGIISNFASTASKTLGEVGAGFLKAFIVQDAAAKILGFFTDIQDKVRRLVDQSRELSVPTELIQVFEKAVVKAGGSVEQAQKIWEHARLAIDKLGAGNEAATKEFAALGLSAQDFLGLSLDQGLEKIAKAYFENRDAAGAYAAIVEILGARQAPQAMVALQKLADQGFGGLSAGAQNLSDKILPSAVAALDSFSRTVSEYSGRVKNFVANIAGGFLNAIQVFGGLAAATTNWLQGQKTDWDAVLLVTEKTTQAVTDQTGAQEALEKKTKEHKGTLDENAAAELAILAPLEEAAKGQDKLNILAKEMVILDLAAGSSLQTTVEREAARQELIKKTAEYKKTQAEMEEKLTEELKKQTEEASKYADKTQEAYEKAKMEALPLEEQLRYLMQQRNADALDMTRHQKDSASYEADYIDLAKTDAQIAALKLKILKDQTAEIDTQAQKLQALNDAQHAHLGLQNLGDISTASLQAAMSQAQQTLANIALQYQQSGYGAGRGGATAAATADNYYLASQIDSIKAELNFRSGFSTAYSRGGTSGALSYYTGAGGNALSFDNALNSMSAWGQGLDKLQQLMTSTNTSLDSINTAFNTLLHG